MARFVWMAAGAAGHRTPINPDQVCYVKLAARGGHAVLVFGAVLGGFHELELQMGVEDAVAALEGELETEVRRYRQMQLAQLLVPIFGPPVPYAP